VAKGPDAFRTISEAADEVGVAQHVLRFWETKFSFIRPMKRAGGRRFYRPQDLAVLCGVRRLLHEDGYTIAGVQRLHRERGLGCLLHADSPPRKGVDGQGELAFSASAQAGGLRDRLTATLAALEEAKARLDEVLEG